MSFSRIVLRVPNWLGDAVMALPAIAAVRRHAGAAEVALAAPASVAPLFAEDTGLGGVETLVLPPRRREQIAALAAGRFNLTILFTNSFGSAWVARRAGVAERWGYRSDFRRALLTRAVPKPRGRVHQADYYRQLVAKLDMPATETMPRIAVTGATRSRAEALLAARGWDGRRALVGFAPGAAYGHAKRWPPARVAELVARLTNERDATAVLVGAAGDRDAGREIESSLARHGGRPDRMFNLIGQTDLRSAMGVLACCRAFVSNDSGAMHLAAALGVPVAAIFGPTDERVTAPLGDHDVIVHPVFCRPCMLRDCPIDHRCMKGIAPARVFEAVARRLELRIDHPRHLS
jgi:heptosyltransferase-2